MELMKKNEYKKIFIVLIVLITLLVGIVLLRMQRELAMKKTAETPTIEQKEEVTPTPTMYAMPGKYTIELSKTNISLGENVEDKIMFYAEGKVLDGSDVILKFDPEVLTAGDISQKGEYFNHYPREYIDNQKGVIKVSGYTLDLQSPMDSPVLLFSIPFTAKNSGQTTLSFDFQQRKTNLTTLIEHQTSRNILGQTDTVSLTVE